MKIKLVEVRVSVLGVFNVKMAAVESDYVTSSEFDPVGKEDHEPETKTNCTLLEAKCLTHIYVSECIERKK